MDGEPIHASIAALFGGTVIAKHFQNRFRETSLHPQLQASGVEGF
jgi:hypothetical protein